MSVSPEIVASLRSSPKGKLAYDRQWMREGRLHDVVNEASQNVRCTCLHPHFSLWKFASPVAVSTKTEVDASDLRNATESSSRNKDPVDDLKRDITDQELQIYDKHWRQLIHEAFDKKRNLFRQHCNNTYQWSLQRLEMLQGGRRRAEELRAKDLEAKQEASNHASQKRHQKLKDEHVSLAKLSDERLKEATLKDKLEQEAAINRKLEFERKVNQFIEYKRSIYFMYEEIASLITSCKNVHLLSDEVHHALQSTNEIMNTIYKIIERISIDKIDQKDVEVVGSFQARAASYLAVIKAGVELVNNKSSNEDTVDSSTTVKEATRSPIVPATHSPTVPVTHFSNEMPEVPDQKSVVSSNSSVSVDDKKHSSPLSSGSSSSLKRYLHYMDLLEKNKEFCHDLATNVALKKYRFELQKAINTPVNAISSQSGTHLRDKLERLIKLLTKHPVETSDRQISISDHPQGQQFCLDLLAKKFVRQGEEQVSSSHKAAFPIAAVIVGLWSKDEAFGELLLGHFFAKCPSLVPYHMSRQQGQSDQEYYSALGYNITEGGLEQSDMFLKRISGIVRLYAAILQSPVPPGISSSHPHGLENGWMWLAKILNTDPLPDITATVLFDFLDMCGHSLHKQYGRQFQKLLRLLCQDYFPKIRAVTPPASGGPITRLETFLQKCVRQGHISPPEGTLLSNFWFT